MKRVLVVEDNLMIRKTLVAILKKYYDVSEAENGIKALSYLINKKTEPFDLLLIDIQMPEMDGIQLLEEIRNIEYNSIICMLTAFGDKENIKNTLKFNVNDYIIKPFEKNVLLDKVELLLTGQLNNPYATVNSKLSGNLGDLPIIINNFNEIELSFIAFETLNEEDNYSLTSVWLEEILGSKEVNIIVKSVEKKSSKLFEHKAIWVALSEQEKQIVRKASMTKKDLGYKDNDE